MKRFLRVHAALIYLLYGLPLHVLITVMLKKTNHHAPPLMPLAVPLTVKVHRTKKNNKTTISAAKPVSAPKKFASTRKRPEHELDAPSISPKSNAAEGQAPPIRSYSSLLPTPADIKGLADTAREPVPDGISSSKHFWSPSLEPDDRRVLVKNASTLHALIDIPLSARFVGELDMATARLSRDPESRRLTLQSLQGQPLFRAILFESLQTIKTKDTIQEIFDSLNRTEFVIALHLVAGEHMTTNDDSFQWHENRLDVYMTRGRHGFSPRGLRYEGGLALGFTLPDEKADRAKAVDEDAFARLTRSPAYVSILTERPL